MPFNRTIRALLPTDTNHADNFNEVYQQLLSNDLMLIDNLTNPNLLINGYLKNAVNQIGQSTYEEITGTAIIPAVDMWYVSGATANITSSGIVITKQNGLADGGLYHHSELTHLLGETVTLSAVIDGILGYVTGTLSDNLIILNFGGGVIYVQKPSTANFVLSAVVITDNATHTVKYLKLEEGSICTKCPVPKDGEEFRACQKYHYTQDSVVSTPHIVVATTTAIAYGSINFPTRMRIVPTITDLVFRSIADGTILTATGFLMLKGVDGISAIYSITFASGNFVVGNWYSVAFKAHAEI